MTSVSAALRGTSEPRKLARVKNSKVRVIVVRKKGGRGLTDKRERWRERHQSKTRILTAFDPRPMGALFFFFFFFFFFIDEGFS